MSKSLPVSYASMLPLVRPPGSDRSWRKADLRKTWTLRVAKRIEFLGNPCGVCDEFEGAQPHCVIVDIGHDHELVSTCFRNERIDARTYRIGRAEDGAREHAHRLRFFRRRPVAFNVVDRRLPKAAHAPQD